MFKVETEINHRALTAMARAVRKTARKKRNRNTRVLGWIVVVLSLMLSLLPRDGVFKIEARNIVTWLVALVIVVTLIWEDKINAYFAMKRMMPGTSKAVTKFEEENYYSTTEIGKTEFHYENIGILAETSNYFVFVFSVSHAQVYDKNMILDGNSEDLKSFIEQKTGKKFTAI